MAIEDTQAPPSPHHVVITTQQTADALRPSPVTAPLIAVPVIPAGGSPSSPTTSLGRVLLAVFTSMLLALLFCGQGIVHAGEGMPDGPGRTITLRVGQTVLRLTSPLHLTWPWEQLQAALGHPSQPAVAPLLATGPPAPPPPPAAPPAKPPAKPLVFFSGTFVRQRLRDWASRHWLAPSRRHRLHPAPQHPPGAHVPQPHLPALPPVTRRNPLRLLVTGDSLVGYLGPILIDDIAHHAPVQGFTDTHDGTGLTRPDYVDWSVLARQQVAADHPEAIVVMMGGNDFQNMTLPPNRFFLAGSAAWTQEYQRRAEVCMRIWTDGGKRRVYWLSMPPARDPAWAYDDAQINIALRRAAAQVPGAEFVDVLGPVTNHGHYTDYVNQNGQPVLIREPDGVHLNIAGSSIVAGEVQQVLAREWHFR